VQALWSQKIGAPLRGLGLARERGWVLAWNSAGEMHLWDRLGRRQAHRSAPAGLAAAACADDGSTFAAVGVLGQVWLLAPDLSPRWERSLGRPGSAVALDLFGGHVAVADVAGGLHLFDRHGKAVWKAMTPRPLRYLTFVPEKPMLAVSADFGLVACFDAAGKPLWRDGLVAHVGSLAVSGDGAVIALACFTEGLCCYAADRGQPQRIAQAAPCNLAALSYTGDVLLTAGLTDQVALRDREGAIRAEFSAEGAVVALALGALADFAILGLTEGQVVAVATGLT
jgi:hypothetical protein